MIGSIIGGQRIVSQLGQGGMGVVYLAEDATLGRATVVKVLRQELSRDREIVGRFVQEARAASAVQHPGIVKIDGFGEHTDGTVYIVMERLVGESLEKRLEREPMLSIADATRIASEIAGVLVATHAAGIVHRDLKPDNVFLAADPDTVGGWRVKLLDFGIAKLAPDAQAPGVRTSTTAFMGTPAYMAPEQCRGAANVDARTDLYALGCILYRMLCGRLPFTGDTIEIVAAQLRDPPPPMRALRRDLSPRLEAAVMRLLEKELDRRFSSAKVLIGALQPAPSDAEIAATETGAAAPVVQELPPGASRRRKAALIGGGIALLVAAGAIALIVMSRNAAPLAAGAGTPARIVPGDCSDGGAIFSSGPLRDPGRAKDAPPATLFQNPLTPQLDALARCAGRSGTRYGVFVIEIAADRDGKVISSDASGTGDHELEACLTASVPAHIPGLSSSTTLRCPFAFGDEPLDQTPVIDVTAEAITVDGEQVATVNAALHDESPSMTVDALADRLKRAVGEDLARARTHRVALSGPWQVRLIDGTDMRLVNMILRTALAADAGIVLEQERSGAMGRSWVPLRPVALPTAPVPLSSAAPLSPLKNWSLVKNKDAPMLSVLITDEKIYIGATRLDGDAPANYTIDRSSSTAWDDYLADLKAIKAAYFKDRTDIEIAAQSREAHEVRYQDLVTAVLDAIKQGFSSPDLTDPEGLSWKPLY